MKYYKLLTKNGYPDNCFIIGKVYPEDFKRISYSDAISELQKYHSKDWEEVPDSEYYI